MYTMLLMPIIRNLPIPADHLSWWRLRKSFRTSIQHLLLPPSNAQVTKRCLVKANTNPSFWLAFSDTLHGSWTDLRVMWSLPDCGIWERRLEFLPVWLRAIGIRYPVRIQESSRWRFSWISESQTWMW
jgi:hypothetical protein